MEKNVKATRLLLIGLECAILEKLLKFAQEDSFLFEILLCRPTDTATNWISLAQGCTGEMGQVERCPDQERGW